MSEQSSAAPAAEAPQANTEQTIENQENLEAGKNEQAQESADQATAEAKDAKPSDKAASKQEAASLKKKLKLKVDGKEFEEEFDPDNEEELIKNLQLSKVAQKRMQEHAQLNKEIESFMKALQTDPERVLREIGLDPEDFAVKTLQRKIDEDQKSPELKEKEKLQKELDDLRQKLKKDEDERKAGELTRIQAEQEKQIEEGMIAALDKHQLGNKPLVVKRMAEVMLTALENNLDLSPMDVAPIVKKELDNDIKEYVGALPDEAIEALLGKDRLSTMRKKSVAAIKKVAETANAVKSTGNDVKAKQPESKAKKSVTFSDFLKG